MVNSGKRAVARRRINRNPTVIVVVELVGHAGLMDADKVGTLHRLLEHQATVSSIISEHGGRTVKSSGNRMLFQFRSSVAAFESAVAVQRAFEERNRSIPGDRRMLFRIGINVGDMLIEDDNVLGQGFEIAVRLAEIAEPGGICLSQTAFKTCKAEVKAKVIHLGDQHFENIDKPVQAYAISPEAATASTEVGAISNLPANGSPRLSIVVLPFVNLGGDKEQDYLVDGITECLTTDLSRIPGAFVIARNTAFSYKGKPVHVRQLGSELGVRYVMNGSVQSAEDRIRIHAQLDDAETGAQLWAERFDKPRANLLDMQDEITARLARTVDIELVAAESRRAAHERPNNLDSWDLTMRGRAIWNQPLSIDVAREARRFFETALRLNERNVDALLGFADAHMWEVNTYISDDRDGQIRIADEAVSKALGLEPNSARAHFSRGTVLYAMRLPDQAIREFEFAIGLDRNLAVAHAYAGLMKFFLGRSGESEAHVAEAMRLSPHDPLRFHWHYLIGVADLYLGRVVRALISLRKSVEINPNWELAQFVLAGALALAGLGMEAAEVCAAARRLAPNFTISKFRAQAVSDNPVYLAQRKRLYEGLRRAGVPEGIDEPPQGDTTRPPSPPAAHAHIEMSYPDFVAALRSALRDFSRPDLLSHNPLLRSRLLAAHGSPGPAGLQALLSETVDELFANPRDEKLRRVIEFTYFHPAPKQEAVAERLGLAFSTYRRHLTTALGRLGTWLWDRLRLDAASVAAPTQATPSLLSRDRPALAVLPFQNMSGDAEQDYFSDGITEDLITGLSKWRWFLVIARNSAFTYKDRAVDVKQVGRELGVRYLLEGSVRRDGTDVRITAQLIDATTGNHIWAEKYDRELTDLLAVQDEITSKVVAAIEPALFRVESQRAAGKRPEHMGAWDYCHRGNWHLHKATGEDAAAAYTLFKTAATLDPDLADVHVGIARSLNMQWLFGSPHNADDLLTEALGVARHAVALDDDNAYAHFILAQLSHYTGDTETALMAAKRAIELNDNLALGYFSASNILGHAGRCEEAIEENEKGLRLSPRDPQAFVWFGYRALALYHLRRYEEAVEAASHAKHIRPHPVNLKPLIASYAQLGLAHEAAATLADLRALPGGSVEMTRWYLRRYSDQTTRSHMITGLRMAGMSEV